MVDHRTGRPIDFQAREVAGPEVLYRSLVESVPSHILLLDLDGTIQYINRTVPEADATILVGSSAFSYLAVESVQPMRAAMAQVLETAEPTKVEVRGVGIGGASAWGEVHLGPVTDDDGTVLAFALVIEDINERRRMEMARRLAGESYEKAFRRSPYPMLLFDPQTRLVHNVNAAALAKYGYSREEFLGLDILELRLPEDRTLLLEHLAAGLPDFHRGVTRHRLRDGRVIDVEVVGQSFEVAGKKLRMVYVEDITEQRRAIEALARSEAANQALIEAIPDLIFRVSKDGRYLSFVPAPNVRLAAHPEEFLGQPLESVLPTDIAGVARQTVTQALASSQAQTFEYELTVGGVRGAYEARLVPVDGEDEVVAIVRDITERKAAEAALRESEERFRTSFEHAPIGMAIVSLDGLLLQVNRSLCDILGFSESQLVGKGLASITHPDDLPANLELIRRSVAGEMDSFRMDKRNIHADGHVVWGSLSTALVRDSGGVPLYLISQIEDVTEAVAAKESLERSATELERRAAELERSNADLAQFANAVSHDLSEPLRMLSVYLNLFASRYRGELDEDADEFIGVLTGSVGRMQVMIRDLLAYSRAGTTDQTFEQVDLNSVGREVLANLADRIDETRAEVAVGRLPVVVGDPSQLRQVLQNLISNSLKFVEVGVVPTIRVDAEMREGLWRISVQDNGIGIEPRYQSRIFIPFRRLHTQEQYPGTGVGLSIAKRIVERHGGTIWMEAPVDGGSEFLFTLPVASESDE
jgi:PAS domain S-box-containing protein